MPNTPSFTCPICGAVSHHPQDVRNRYCGRCHVFTADELTPAIAATLVSDPAIFARWWAVYAANQRLMRPLAQEAVAQGYAERVNGMLKLTGVGKAHINQVTQT